MKFKVGDLVRVRDDLKINKQYGKQSFIDEMRHFKGKITTIIKVFSDGTYLIKYCDWWNWTDEMLEKVNPEDFIKQFLDEYKEEFKNFDVNFSVTPKPQILDEVEKRYLSDVIRPFRNRVINIEKIETLNHLYQFISIYIYMSSIDQSLTGGVHIVFPYFKANTMYKGMEVDKGYTLEELGL